MRTSFILALLCTLTISIHSAVWEFELGGLVGAGLLGGNEVDSLPNSIATGKEVPFNEIPGILFDDSENALEFHVGWGSHEIIQGAQLAGQYISSAIYGPAGMDQNSPNALYSFGVGTGFIPANGEPTGRTGFVHARIQLTQIGNYTVEQQVADLLGSRWYFNIISTAYETGEIRGQLISPIPETREYLGVAALGLAVFAVCRRRTDFLKSAA